MKNSYTHILIIIALSLMLASCFARSSPVYDLPYSYDPNAPETWKLGWQHGCESGLSVYGSDYYKSIYKFKQDVTRVNDNFYYKGWNDSFNFCRSYINRTLAGDSKSRDVVPALFSSDNLDITRAGKRDDLAILKSGIFSGTDSKGMFGNAFTLYTPGYGSTAWGASVDECDWLNRCGADKPKDPIDALMGQ